MCSLKFTTPCQYISTKQIKWEMIQIISPEGNITIVLIPIKI